MIVIYLRNFYFRVKLWLRYHFSQIVINQSKLKLPGIVTIELTQLNSKWPTLTLTYKSQSKSAGLHSDLYMDELAKVFRDLADWLEQVMPK